MNRPVRHLTPRYIMNRSSLRWHERSHPAEPWLTPDAVRILHTALRPEDIGLEWGSGRSTLWLAGHLGHLTSVEHDPHWHEKVARQLREANAENVTYELRPTTGDADSQYVAIVSGFEDASLDFALVDGALRDHCTAAVLPKIAAGGLLCIDNANWFFDHPTRSPTSRTGRGALTESWGDCWDVLTRWRMIWTTSGVTDTAIWLRPGAPRLT